MLYHAYMPCNMSRTIYLAPRTIIMLPVATAATAATTVATATTLATALAVHVIAGGQQGEHLHQMSLHPHIGWLR